LYSDLFCFKNTIIPIHKKAFSDRHALLLFLQLACSSGKKHCVYARVHLAIIIWATMAGIPKRLTNTQHRWMDGLTAGRWYVHTEVGAFHQHCPYYDINHQWLSNCYTGEMIKIKTSKINIFFNFYKLVAYIIIINLVWSQLINM